MGSIGIGPKTEDPGAEIRNHIAQLLRGRFGFRGGQLQERSLADAVRERMRALGRSNPADYLRDLLSDGDDGRELPALLSEYTNTETHFFRHRGRFELLCARVLPELLARKNRSPRPLRLLSAGCSSGDEVYSIVMSLWPHRSKWNPFGLEVVGCDINERALAKARLARYGSWPLRFAPPNIKAGFFAPCPGEHGILEVNEAVRRHTSFRRANLVDPGLPDQPGMAGFDVIFCCNVIIYLDGPSTVRLLDNLWRMLEPDGFLFLGYTENFPGLRQTCETVSSQDYVAYRKPRPERPATPAGEHVRGPLPRDPVVPSAGTKVKAPAAAAPGPDENTAGLCELARRHCLADRHEAAAEIVDRLLDRAPHCAPARLLRGHLLCGRGERAAAADECIKVLDIDPLCAAAHLLLGMLLAEAEALEDAVGEVRKALFLDRDLPLAHYTLGKLQAGQGNREEAVRAFSAAIRVVHAQPDKPVAAELPVELGARALAELAEQQIVRLKLGGS
ncbi:MAG: methyltransferase [Deltaproteobacteria bacterium]|nr:methyltransferase [Deltaproteobacteria bacterium]